MTRPFDDLPLSNRPIFHPGSIHITAGLASLVERGAVSVEEVAALISRHCRGDWGDLDVHDRFVNEAALESGASLLSAYKLAGKRVWVITDPEQGIGNRVTTTVLLPDEY